MKIFVSWSGDKSRLVANAVQWWLSIVHQGVETWVSTRDIHVGDRWAKEIEDGLADATYGIICATPDNVNSKWINYEAGAISKKIGTETNKVAVLLIDFASETDLEMPLSQFHAVLLSKNGFQSLATSINNAIGSAARSDTAVLEATEIAWPRLEEKLKAIRVEEPDSKKRKRSDSELLEELVLRVRNMDERIESLVAEQRPVRDSTTEKNSSRRLGPPIAWPSSDKISLNEDIGKLLKSNNIDRWNVSYGEKSISLVVDEPVPPHVLQTVEKLIGRHIPWPFQLKVVVDPDQLTYNEQGFTEWQEMKIRRETHGLE